MGLRIGISLAATNHGQYCARHQHRHRQVHRREADQSRHGEEMDVARRLVTAQQLAQQRTSMTVL